MENKVQFDENLPLLIEVTEGNAPAMDTDNTREMLSIGANVRQASQDSIRQAFNTIYSMARRTGNMIEALQGQETQESLEAIEIQFGLKFNGSTEAFIASAGAEATVNVKISWKPSQVGDKADD